MTPPASAPAPADPLPGGASAPRARRAPPYEGTLVLWAVASLLLAVTTVRVPNTGAWLGAKAFALEAVGIIAACWVAYAGDWSGQRVRRALTAGPNLAILGFLGWIGLSAARSELPELSRYELMRHLGGALLYAAVVYGVAVRERLGALVGLLLGAICAGIVTALVGFSRSDLTPEAGEFGQGSWRVAGAFANPQLFAAFLCLLLPIAWMAARAERHPRRHLLALVATVLALGGVLVSQNRSVWIGSAVGLVALLVLYLAWGRDEESAGMQKQHLIVPGIMVVLCLVLFVGMARRGWSLPERAATLTALSRDRAYRERLGMWSKALRMAAERPVWGWGTGLYPVRQARFPHPDVPAGKEETVLRTGITLSENAHNTYLQLLAELGYPGLGLYLAIFAAFFTTAFRALRRLRPGYRKSMLLASGAAVLGQMVCAVGNPAWEFAECSLFLWLVLGLGMAAAGVGERA